MAVITYKDAEEYDGRATAENISGGRCAYDTVNRTDCIENEHERNVENTFPHEGENQRFCHMSRCLEEGDDRIRPRGERTADAHDAQKDYAVMTGFRTAGNEEADQFVCKNKGSRHTAKGNGYGHDRGEIYRAAHTPFVTRCKIVSDKW